MRNVVIGGCIQRLRKREDMTQFQLCVVLGRSIRWLRMIERGYRGIRSADLLAVEQALGESPGSILATCNRTLERAGL